MGRMWLGAAVGAVALGVPAVGLAESHNPADYPLRVHVFRRSETTFYERRQTEEVKGEGRANLFENSEPKGLDFQFDCDQKLQTSSGYETFPAKWKKPGAELVVLQPVFGKAGSYTTCKFKVMMKDFAYMSKNGSLSTEPAAAFKAWMVRHDYDPEHGKTMPVAAAAPGGPGSPAAAGAPTAGQAPPAPAAGSAPPVQSQQM